MLTHLAISNLAIIDQLEVAFGPGLAVVTGETGAGKSIILGAVNLLMGARASSGLVGPGRDEARISGLFELPDDKDLAVLLAEAGLDGIGQAGEMLISRVVTAAGRSRAYINNKLVNLGLLTEIGGRLLSISGQHEAHRLLGEDFHIQLLDRYGRLEPLVDRTAELHQAAQEADRRLAKLRGRERDKNERRDLLSFQLEELDRAAVAQGEEKEIEAEAARLRHAEKLIQGSRVVHQALSGDDQSAAILLAQAKAELERLARLDSTLDQLVGQLEQAVYAVEDAAFEVDAYGREIVFDPERQVEVEDRLALIRRLFRKYNVADAEELADRRREIEEEFDSINNLDRELARLGRAADQANRELKEAADRLTDARRETATRLTEPVEAELSELGLEGARFSVELEQRPGPIQPDGADLCRFAISTNPGQPLKPLAKIASGGELSRITLALKTILARRQEVETVIFDEVDAGIGGRIADVVGRKLKNLSAGRQILCITHLPQIAAYGQRHLKVIKSSADGRTRSTIEPLKDRDRVAELARMLAGEELTDKARAHAAEMLKRASEASPLDGRAAEADSDAPLFSNA